MTPRPSKIFIRWSFIVILLGGMMERGGAQGYSLSNVWTQYASSAETTNVFDSAFAENRGIAYDAARHEVLAVNKGKPVVSSYDAATGNLLVSNAVNLEGVHGGAFPISKIGFASDGVLYGANMNTSISASEFYKVYSWTALDVAPRIAFTSSDADAIGVNLKGQRVGDTFAITGGGSNTMILAGVDGTNDFVLLSAPDGTNFTSTALNVTAGLPAPGSGVQFGIAFYTNNTFIVAPNDAGALYLVQFPTNVASQGASLVSAIVLTNVAIEGNWLDLAYDPHSGLLAAHANATSDVELYDLPENNFTGLSLLATNSMPLSTDEIVNGNMTGDIALGGLGLTNEIYILESNAGLAAAAIYFTTSSLPELEAFPLTIESFTKNSFALSYQVVTGHTYQVQFSEALNSGAGGWSNLGPSFVSAQDGVETVTNAAPTDAAQFYRVVAQ